jgi:hypothetical protein
MLLPKQRSVEASRTGLRPNDVVIGTLTAGESFLVHSSSIGNIPDKVTESKDENRHAAELDGALQVGIKLRHQLQENGCVGQRTETLRERDHGNASESRNFPERAPFLQRHSQKLKETPDLPFLSIGMVENECKDSQGGHEDHPRAGGQEHCPTSWRT